MTAWMTAGQIAAGMLDHSLSAQEAVTDALDRIGRATPINAFTDVLTERALFLAKAHDMNGPQGPLAGVPFAVKNLFDVEDLPTRAGSRINRGRAPATADAFAIQQLERAGAILVGTLNMGEYAYDFTGENAHDGACRNPHDPARMTGGSSSGSGAAVAAGVVPFTLGSDTNGSIRVPASLCGVFGLKPTYGRLSRAGTFPFVSSLDHIGPLARTVGDLQLAYDAMTGPDPADPVCTGRPTQPAPTGSGACGSPSPAGTSWPMPGRTPWRRWTASPPPWAPRRRSSCPRPPVPAPPPTSSPRWRARPCTWTGCEPSPAISTRTCGTG